MERKKEVIIVVSVGSITVIILSILTILVFI